MLAVVTDVNTRRSGMYLREHLADAVNKCIQRSHIAPSDSIKDKVSPPAVALLRVASKFSKVCRNEHILSHTDTTIVVLDILSQRVYTVACGVSARLPVVADLKGEVLVPEHTHTRQLSYIKMEEATYAAPPGQYNVVLGNQGLWCVLCFCTHLQ